MKTVGRWLSLVMALASVLMLFGRSTSTYAAPVTFTPARIQLTADEIPNSGRGLYQWRRQTFMCPSNLPSNQDNYQRWNWSDIETSQGVYEWTSIQDELTAATNRGQRTWIGLAMAVVPGSGETALPGYMQKPGWAEKKSDNDPWYPNYNNPLVQARLEALLDSFIATFPNDPRIAGIQMRSYGQYGENYIPWDTPTTSTIWATPATAEWMINAWHTRLRSSYRLMIALTDQNQSSGSYQNNNRYIFQYAMTKEPKWAWYRDALGHQGQMDNIDAAMASIVVINGVNIGTAVTNRWQYEPVFTEMIGGYLSSRPVSEQDAQFGLALQQVPQYHVSLVGNGNFAAKYATGPWYFWDGSCRPQTTNWTQQNIDDFVLAGKKAGYRYAIQSMTVGTITPGSSVQITTKWENDGVAPTYDPWTVKFQLRSSSGTVVWEGASSVNLKTILPTNGTPVTVNDSFTMPNNLVVGTTYQLHVSIPPFIPNVSYVPAMRLAMSGWQSGSKTHLIGNLTAAASTQITLRGQTTSGIYGTSLTLSKPSGIVAGDVMIAQISGRNPSLTLTQPTGWTLIRRDVSSYTIDQQVYYRVATASEPANYTWTYNGSTHIGGGIIGYTGVDTTNPINAHGGQVNSSSSVTAPSITTTVANAKLVFFGSIAWGYASFTPPSSMTEQYEQRTSSVNVSSESADSTQANAGSTGSRAATASASGTNIGQLIALNPQP